MRNIILEEDSVYQEFIDHYTLNFDTFY